MKKIILVACSCAVTILFIYIEVAECYLFCYGNKGEVSVVDGQIKKSEIVSGEAESDKFYDNSETELGYEEIGLYNHDYRLVATFRSNYSSHSIAFLASSEGMRFVGEGEFVEYGLFVKEVGYDHVVLSSEEGARIIYMQNISEIEYTAHKELVEPEDHGATADELWQGEITPNYVRAVLFEAFDLERVERGYRVGDSAAEMLLEMHDLKVGDVAISANGYSFGNMGEEILIYRSYRELGFLNLVVEREGTIIEIKVSEKGSF